ncbi:PAS domain-containing sensor histidine kinase [Chitinasiproducens palmae]|uniref:PAS domain S-box-containing protein n=1 Tax=Chitinasiproducens palmae TaxID=1770053 RepID=A0A1H2PP83_9BURK|nr:PAS domain S-box-containing protein [Chitinasiproducens palmae]
MGAGSEPQRLHLDQARLAGIIRSAMEAIITIDATQTIVIFNPMAEKLFRCTAAEAVGEPLDRFIPARYRAAHRGQVAGFGQTGVTERSMGKQLPLRALRADGEEFPIEASISQLGEGDAKLYTVMLRDITERMRGEAELRASRNALQQLSGSLQSAREEEKQRIARELHDDLGQRLTALKMDLSLHEADIQANADRATLLEQTAAMQRLIDATVASLRRISADLRPIMLDDLGLSAALEWLVHDFERRYALDVTLDADEDLDCPPATATAVFRIVQEGLNNIARHAGASRVAIALAAVDGQWQLCLRDDGHGVAPEALRALENGMNQEGRIAHFGLLGIRERVRLLGGEVAFSHPADGGFQILARLPQAEVQR